MYRDVCWDKGETVRAGVYAFYLGKKNNNHQLGKGLFVQNRIVTAVKGVEFVSDRTSYITLRGRWCNIITLNVHTSSQEKSDDSKDCFMSNNSMFSSFSDVSYKNSVRRF